jgi:hypothetical protein
LFVNLPRYPPFVGVEDTALTLCDSRATINKTPPAFDRIAQFRRVVSGSRRPTRVPFMAWKSRRTSRALWLIWAALFLSGCQEQEMIRSYTVSKESFDFGPSAAKQRMLAVMVPQEKEVWFFKLMGPEQAVGEQVTAFDRFVDSVRFTKDDKEPLKFSVPDGWKKLAGDELFYARVRQEGKELPLEITISKLPKRVNYAQSNIDRWRGQLGLGPISDIDLNKLVGNIKVDDVESTRVDFVGKSKKPAGGGPAPTVGRGKPFRYDKPADWEEGRADMKQGVYRPAVFIVRDGDHLAEVSVVPLAGQGGGARANVNRWRMQLGLDPIGDEQLQQDLRKLPVEDANAPYIDLTGRGPTGPQRILGAWLVHGGRTWFITMKGSPELVGKQQAAFEAFVKSIRFGDGQGAAHE